MPPSPIPAHRTGRADFPHPALRLVSRDGSRLSPQVHPSKPQDPQFAEDRAVIEAACAPRGHLVATPEKVAYAFVDVVIHSPIGEKTSPVAEVVGPASEQPVELLGHGWPGALIAGSQGRPDLLLQPPDRLLRRLCGQVPVAVLAVPLRTATGTWPQRDRKSTRLNSSHT